jgi:hypothetical protein
MSTLSPLVKDWIANNLEWQYLYSPKRVPKLLEPLEMYKIGEHRYPEGILISCEGAFDSPKCGLRMRASPTLDTERTHTISYMVGIGCANIPMSFEMVVVPPTSPPGIYTLVTLKEWPWTKYVELYVYNDDPDESHWCLGAGYTMLALVKPRLTPSPEVEAKILEAQQELVKALTGVK